MNDRLRESLVRRGLTPADLAEHLGVDAKTVERWITVGRLPYARHRHRVAALLRQSEAFLWPAQTPTGRRHPRMDAVELVELFPDRASVPPELWRRFLDEAHEQIDVVVYAGLFLPEQHPRLNVALRDKGQAGTKVRLLIGDPGCAAVARRGDDEGIGEALASKIRNVLVHYAPLRGALGVDVRLHPTTLHNSLYRFDDELLVNAHVYGLPAGHAPVLHLRKLAGRGLFDTYAESIERVAAASRPAWLDGDAE